MYVIGFCDSVLDMLLEYSTDFDGIVGTAKDRANDIRLIGCISLVAILGLAIVGMDWVTRVRKSNLYDQCFVFSFKRCLLFLLQCILTLL
jgi:hypothetical protein